MQGVWVWSLVGELRFYMPRGQKPKTSNRSNIVTNSIKTLKMVHPYQKVLKKKKGDFNWYSALKWSESWSVVSNSLQLIPCPWDSPGQNTGVGGISLFQGIFLTQVSHIVGRFFTSWATREAPYLALAELYLLCPVYFSLLVSWWTSLVAQ